MFDVIVIGGGVVGGLILRELTKYKLSACLVEKEGDVSMGASKANSGIVHAGYDAKEGSLKAKFTRNFFFYSALPCGAKCLDFVNFVLYDEVFQKYMLHLQK